MDSTAITKIQSIILITIVVVAALGGAVYVLLGGEQPSSETIKIGVCADIDNFVGSAVLQGVVLAIEQVNAEGGVLGRKFEVVAEDDDSESGNDVVTATNAFTRLVTVEKADFVICHTFLSSLIYQDLAAQFKKILLLNYGSFAENATERVEEDYATYKYFFMSGGPNFTVGMEGTIQSVLDCREYTGFNKIALVSQGATGEVWIPFLDYSLKANDFEVVYIGNIPQDAVDFSSYFVQAETAGAEILYPIIFGPAGISFVKEYYDRQSPMVLWGFIGMAQQSNFWELTEGKCEYTSNNGYPIVAGYPLTSKTLPVRDAYIERWGEEIISGAAAAYDTIRFILPDAIRRAGTIETNAVIAALEPVDVETSSARHFMFTNSHAVLIPSVDLAYPGEDYFLVCMFQWQDGVQKPVFPKAIMEEAGTKYQFPPWSGPWD